jgi:hypothetical protein
MVGAAYAHGYAKDDVHYELNGVCLPIAADSEYGYWAKNSSLNAEPRVAFAPTQLGLGVWNDFFSVVSDKTERSEDRIVAEGGFLAVSIRAVDPGARGEAFAWVDGERRAGAAVHWFEAHNEFLVRESFCVPAPAGSTLAVELTPTVRRIDVRARWIPLTGDWKMEASTEIQAGTSRNAETDGILHAFLQAQVEGARGWIALYTAGIHQPWAASSVHRYRKHDRWGLSASAMLPVGKNAEYVARLVDTPDRRTTLNLWWTAIEPTARPRPAA